MISLLYKGNQYADEGILEYVKRLAYLNGFVGYEEFLSFLKTHFSNVYIDQQIQDLLIDKVSNPLLDSVNIPYSSGHLKSRKHLFAKNRGYNFGEIELLLLKTTQKKIYTRNYKTPFNQSKLHNSCLKVCIDCWNDKKYIRVYWHICGYNNCHIHNKPMIEVTDLSYTEDIYLQKEFALLPSSFEEVLVSVYHRPDYRIDFFSLEKEVYLKAQEVNVVNFLTSIYELSFSIKLDAETTITQINTGMNITLEPKQRLLNIVNSLSKEEARLESELIIFLILLNSLTMDLINKYSFLDYVFKMMKTYLYIDTRFYRTSLNSYLLEGEVFTDLKSIFSEHQGNLVEQRNGKLFIKTDSCRFFLRDSVLDKPSFSFLNSGNSKNYSVKGQVSDVEFNNYEVHYFADVIIKLFEVEDTKTFIGYDIWSKITGIKLD